MLRRTPIRRFIRWVGVVLTAVLTSIWIGSLWFIYSYRAERWDTAIGMGRIQIGWNQPYMGGPGNWIRWQFHYAKMNGSPRTMYWRFNYYPADGSGWAPRIFIPLWSPALLFGVPTGIFFARDAIARRRLFMQGKCPHCAFDRSGLVPDAKCPECGKLASLTS